MVHHAGQIALPGGMVDPGEENQAAMRRELWEELGVRTVADDCVGPLSPLYVFNSRFWVQPWLVVLGRRPDFILAADEVDALIEYPLIDLRSCSPAQTCRIDRWGTHWTAPCFRWQQYEIWGATCLILGEFQALLIRQLDG
jgi:hypothetical protein